MKDYQFFGNSLKQFCRTIKVLNESKVQYEFQYNYITDPKESGVCLEKELPKWVRFPYIGGQTAHTSGIGLFGGGWYRHGFLDIRVNGKGLQNTLVKEIRIQSGERGEVVFVWEPAWATIKARFVLMPRDEKVYLDIEVKPKEEVMNGIEVQLLAYPGGTKGNGTSRFRSTPRDRWICTELRNIQHGEEDISLNLDAKEYWAFCFDSRVNTKGSCAMFYVPDEVSEVKANILNNELVRFKLTCYPEQYRLRLLLLSFHDDYKHPDQAYRLIKTNASGILDLLRTFRPGPLK